MSRRFHGRDEAMASVYLRAAGDLGHLLAGHDPWMAANRLVDAIAARPQAWAEWLPATLEHTPQAMARIALEQVRARQERAAGWLTVIRHLADAASDVEAFRETYSAEALATPAVAVEVARRYMAASQVGAAGKVLRGAAPKSNQAGRLAAPNFDWETAWIDYLERAGDTETAQAVRWASFERTLDVGRARAFTTRLTGFDDVESESRAFAHAAQHPDFQLGLKFLMAWPALPEASLMIEARKDDIDVDAPEAELWAAKLRRRFPAAAHLLLRRAAAAAFRRREFNVCDRLTQEAETIVI